MESKYKIYEVEGPFSKHIKRAKNFFSKCADFFSKAMKNGILIGVFFKEKMLYREGSFFQFALRKKLLTKAYKWTLFIYTKHFM